MAINKRKVLSAAQKFLQRGALDKALKEYRALLKVSPRDANTRLKIADILLRKGNKEEAIDAYLRVGEQFMRDGFDAKAVAIYKQLCKIDGKRHDFYVPLAELYQRMGLTAEAVNALQTAAEGFQREGRKRDALDLLRRMATLDPTNTTSRRRIADVLQQEGLTEEAVSEYEAVAAELERQGEGEEAVATYERVLQLDPDRCPALRAVSRALVAQGDAPRAETYALRAVEGEPEAPESYELLASVYTSLGRQEALESTYRKLADLYRSRGDEDRARDIMQRFVRPEFFAAEGETPDFSSFEQPAGAPEAAVPAPPPEPEAAETGDGSLSASDTEEMLAEAGLYMRYGKVEPAIERFERVLRSEPGHREALERLGEAWQASEVPERAVEAWVQAAGAARTAGDLERFYVLQERIRSLDPEAADRLASDGGEARAEGPAAGETDSEEFLLDEPEEPETGSDAGPVSAGATATPEAGAAEEPAGEEPLELEIEVGDADEDADAREGASAAPESTPDQDEPAARSADPAASRGSTSASAASSRQIAEELEEADFYLQQGLVEEAETVYRRILSMAPDQPQALLRLGEIAKSRGEEPEPGASEAPAETASDRGAELADEEAIGVDDDLDLEVDLGDLDAAPEAGTGGAPRSEEQDDSTATDFRPAALERDSGVPRSDEADTETQISARSGEWRAREEPQDAGSEAPGEPSGSGSGFDLAQELSEVLSEDGGDGQPAGVTRDEGFDAIFRDFKQGVSRTLAEGDYETHYDLGIAYREMGLLDDAVGEFRVALGSPERRVDALHMLGLCAIDLGRSSDAVAHLEQALAGEELPDEQRSALRFDLGCAYEETGDTARARAAFAEVASRDPEFRDVRSRLAALESDDFETRAGPAEESETFESFDDVIAEAEAHFEASEAGAVPPGQEPGDDEPAPEAEAPGAASDPEPERAGGRRRPRGRRRKISFV